MFPSCLLSVLGTLGTVRSILCVSRRYGVYSLDTPKGSSNWLASTSNSLILDQPHYPILSSIEQYSLAIGTMVTFHGWRARPLNPLHCNGLIMPTNLGALTASNPSPVLTNISARVKDVLFS